MWIIKDWTGKICFGGKEFDCFDDGWAHIYENDPEPEPDSPRWMDGWYDDYYVEEIEEVGGVGE